MNSIQPTPSKLPAIGGHRILCVEPNRNAPT
jgi:hypothetical protein